MQTPPTVLEVLLFLGRTLFGTSLALITLLPAAILAVIAYRRMDPALHRQLRVLLWMPAIWLSFSLWSALLWGTYPRGHYPAWVYYPAQAALWLMLAFVIVALWRLRGARFFVAVTGLYNLFVTWLLVVVMTMSLTGAAL